MYGLVGSVGAEPRGSAVVVSVLPPTVSPGCGSKFFEGPRCLLLETFRFLTMKNAFCSEHTPLRKVLSLSGRVVKTISKV
jgi:hypothetical protein